VAPCTCAFMTWGLWGGDVTDMGGTTNRIHLAQFVTGQVTTLAQLAALAGPATFNGHEIGTTALGGGAIPTSVYETGGQFALSWNFSTGSGSATLSNFDPKAFGPGKIFTFPTITQFSNQFVQAGAVSILGNF